MRIAVFTDSFYPELGGIQDAIDSQTRELGRRGHDVLIVAPSIALTERGAELFREVDLGPSVRVVRMAALPVFGSTGHSRIMLPFASRRVGPILDRFRPDVIHAQTFLSAGRAGVREADRLRLPLVGTNHWATNGFGLYAPQAIRAGLTAAAERYVNRFYDRCHVVTAPSAWLAQRMVETGHRSSVIRLSNPIDTCRFRPPEPTERQTIRAQFGMVGPVAVYAGRLAREKHVDVLIRSLRLSAARPGPTLAIAGDGIDRARLTRLASTEGVSDRVRFLGRLGPSRLAELFQAADVFMTASVSESQCMALLQAMRCGLPAVVSDSCALPEALDGGGGIIARTGCPSSFARALDRLLNDEALYRATARAALIKGSRFSVAHVTDQWESLYEKLKVNAFRTPEHPGSSLQRSGAHR